MHVDPSDPVEARPKLPLGALPLSLIARFGGPVVEKSARAQFLLNNSVSVRAAAEKLWLCHFRMYHFWLYLFLCG